jgi:excinuclease ABC subunit B
VGINLLREGLDIPEVSLVAILDADKEGFLRSERSLIQTIGRAARHLRGTAILYADTLTESMKRAISETDRRRHKQVEFNQAHGIAPRGVSKQVRELIDGVYNPDSARAAKALESDTSDGVIELGEKALSKEIRTLEKKMLEHARNLEFEKAAEARDRLSRLKQRVLGADGKANVLAFAAGRAA